MVAFVFIVCTGEKFYQNMFYCALWAKIVEVAVDKLQLRLFLQALSLLPPQSNPFPTYAVYTQINRNVLFSCMLIVYSEDFF